MESKPTAQTSSTTRTNLKDVKLTPGFFTLSFPTQFLPNFLQYFGECVKYSDSEGNRFIICGHHHRLRHGIFHSPKGRNSHIVGLLNTTLLPAIVIQFESAFKFLPPDPEPFESMATSTYRALNQMLHRSTQKGFNLRAAPPNLAADFGNSLSNFMLRREFIGVSQAEVHPSVFYADLLRKNMETINTHDMLRLDQIRPPKTQKITVEDARKFLRLARLETLKRSLHRIPHDSISYNEFLQVCREALDQSSEKEAMALAKLLDESGHILVIGHKVHLRPEKVARAIEEAIALSPAAIAHPCREELADLEKQKAEIDYEAEKRTKAELWWGLGIFAAKNAVFIRWTFWDLSWDVMEPVCYFVTAFYFMAAYVFFLTTSAPPTFGGFFRARFLARQRQLMKQRNFDAERLKELQTLSMPRFKYN